jgi:hypothetical protein
VQGEEHYEREDAEDHQIAADPKDAELAFHERDRNRTAAVGAGGRGLRNLLAAVSARQKAHRVFPNPLTDRSQKLKRTECTQ